MCWNFRNIDDDEMEESQQSFCTEIDEMFSFFSSPGFFRSFEKSSVMERNWFRTLKFHTGSKEIRRLGLKSIADLVQYFVMAHFNEVRID